MEEKSEQIEFQGNRQIEAMLAQSQFFECDFSFALACLNGYLGELEEVRAGVKFKELGISQRKKESTPKIIFRDGGVIDDFRHWETEIPAGSIAHIPIRGFMRAENGLSSTGAVGIAQNIRGAFSNPNIDGVLLDVYSGGGESSAGSIIKNALSERNKPVVAIAHMAASAAYRAISKTDEIMAAGEAAEFGSIGTMIPMDTKALGKYRDRFVSFYGTTAPDKNASIRAAVAGDFSKLQEEVNLYTEKFQAEIKKDRQLMGELAESTLSGGMFFAADAKKRGLVDSIGNQRDAIARIYSLKKGYK